MRFTISKTFTFSAAHQLRGLPLGHQCANLHGHNYRVTLTLASETLDERGFVVDYGDLHRFKTYLASNYDHSNLNDIYTTKNPSAENIAEALFCLATGWYGGLVESVTVSETDATAATYGK